MIISKEKGKKNDEKSKKPKLIKKVQFKEETVDNEKIKKVTLTPYKKGWHSKLQADGQPFMKGSFTEKEFKILKHSICQFVSVKHTFIFFSQLKYLS